MLAMLGENLVALAESQLKILAPLHTWSYSEEEGEADGVTHQALASTAAAAAAAEAVLRVMSPARRSERLREGDADGERGCGRERMREGKPEAKRDRGRGERLREREEGRG